MEVGDRISALPDAILHQILSDADVQTAVQTSVLAKRWRYVWTSLPNLELDHKDFFTRREEDRGLPLDTKLRRFTHFVDGVLSRRDNSDLCALTLVCPCDKVDPSIIIEKCLCYAVRHNVQRLYLWVTKGGERFEFPSCLINCVSLQVLKLKCSGITSLDNPLHYWPPLRLPMLKILHIQKFWDSANFIAGTVEHCPSLETLILDGIGTYNLNITAPKLRRLDIFYETHGLRGSLHYESVVAISAPRLTSFKLRGNYVSPVFSTVSLPCLAIVYIDLGPKGAPGNEDRFPLDVMNMLGRLGEAKYVTLSSKTLQVLAKDPGLLKSHPSPFHQLKQLKLTQPMECSCDYFYDGQCSSVTLPLDVISYLTQGSLSGGTLVVTPEVAISPWL
ncbi:hypothetical protein RHGRI_031623 [Rhododendron griersonianum]|uniref:F-box domain-containing protein n=1 Tax=Rhododendron griersonianum TaxID=479676 RepID=A0AAV6IEC6_9ERIC|nr:hypothetical protein RHGRI_031623 [Rhododendron griersonianum]